MKTTLKSFWNGIPQKHRPFAIASLAAVPLSAFIAGQFPTDAEYVAQKAARASQEAHAAQLAEVTAAQQAASDALQQKINQENSVKSECWQFARHSAKDPGSVRDGSSNGSWINGDVTGDFVVIQPITGENSFGARVSATAVCSGNNGVITSYRMDG